ncbi:MAG: formylmethanofuran dehydrogenase subunit B [Gammaproteobacteria bacterium RIFCSPLOWO2_02_FULL_61_13]|nr:MAG: formylmethanofuran dehydrogenase subunit B [Gammaproteobacteria bacterium RIFCSPLOWO2_02_FULL_61_13]
MSNNLRVVENATCTFCGCVCDDMILTVDDTEKRIVKAKNACVLGRAWFAEHTIEDAPAAMISGKPASVDDAVAEAARILVEARFPIIYGLSDTTCEAQRQAVAITDMVRGNIDTTTSVCHGPSGLAFQGIGESTMTLGEVKNRADLVVYWGGNPAESHPRHFTRYTVTPKGMFMPNGKKDRTVVLVDVRRTPSAPVANIFVQLKPGKDFELLWALRARVKGREIKADIEEITGVSLAVIDDLVQRMKTCRYGVLFFGMGLTMTRGRHFNSGALLALATDLNEFTHFVAKPVRGHGNVTGADNVVSWQTGYPFGVNFSRGYPRFNPGEFTTVDTLSRGDADAAMIIASDPASNFPKAAIAHLRRIPVITLDTKPTLTSSLARVAFRTSTYGINTGGTVYRMDDVPITLRKAFDSPFPDDETILRALKEKVQELLRSRMPRGAKSAFELPLSA